MVIMSALENDNGLLRELINVLVRRRRTRWKEKLFEVHQSRIKRQVDSSLF